MSLQQIVEAAKGLALLLGVESCDDYTLFTESPNRLAKIYELQRPSDHRLGPVDFAETCFYVTTMTLWSKYGHNVFDLDDGLLSALLLTSPTTEPGFPHLPFPSFFVRISPGFVPFLPSDRVASAGSAGNGWVTMLQVTYLKNALLRNTSPANVLRITSMSDGNAYDTASFHETLYENLFTNSADYLRSDDNVLWTGEGERDGLIASLSHATLRLIFNLCSWLESVGGMAKQKVAGQILTQMAKKKGKTRATRWMLGSELKIGPEIINAAKQSALGRKGGWHVTRRHVVRGHIRHQACGPKHTERKIIWIAPFFQGPKDGDVMDHVYKVADKLRKQSRNIG